MASDSSNATSIELLPPNMAYMRSIRTASETNEKINKWSKLYWIDQAPSDNVVETIVLTQCHWIQAVPMNNCESGWLSAKNGLTSKKTHGSYSVFTNYDKLQKSILTTINNEHLNILVDKLTYLLGYIICCYDLMTTETSVHASVLTYVSRCEKDQTHTLHSIYV